MSCNASAPDGHKTSLTFNQPGRLQTDNLSRIDPNAMTRQNDLFTQAPSSTPEGAASGQALTALKFDATQLSPAQKRFNLLLGQTEKLADKIAATQALTDRHRVVFCHTLPPLQKEYDDLLRKMACWLDERLKQKGLSAKLKGAAKELICSMAGSLAIDGDEAMQVLHDAHSDHSLEDQNRAATAELQSFMEGMLGEKMGDDGSDFDNLHDLMRASAAKMQAQNDAAQEAKASKSASKRKKTAAQTRAEQQTLDADGALRTIYRQLASALHPDRETDPDEHIRKTALMKDANAAYERRDLLALLQLQLKAELVDNHKISNLAKEKLAALTNLLKERVVVLTHELYRIEHQAIAEFDLPMYAPFSAASLKRQLASQQQQLEGDIEAMKNDLAKVPDDRYFKHWLREQHELRHDEFDPLDFIGL